MSIMNISKCKSRWGRVQWVIRSESGEWMNCLPTLKMAKNTVRWWGDKPRRRVDMDFSSCTFRENKL